MGVIEVPIDGVTGEIKKETLIISSKTPLKTLSSSLLGGGFRRTRHILNHHVERDFSHISPPRYLKSVAIELGLKDRVVGMMTAAKLENLSIAAAGAEGLKVMAVVTGGISNAAAAGEKPDSGKTDLGTINTILLIDGRLSEAAMAGSIITAAEAKTVALRELKVRSVSNDEIATGTTTDAVVVACTQRGYKHEYAGTATVLGGLIGSTVKEATIEAIKKQEGWG